MKRLVLTAMGVGVLAAAFAGASLATGPVGAQAPDARLAVLINGGDTTGTFQILRAKGIALVSNPATGYFCIKPKSSTMKLGKIVPTVTIDAAGTPNSDTIAVWSHLNIVCPSGTIEVETYQIGTRVSRNRAGFTLVVI